MSALLEFYFRFYRIGMLFCTKLPNYIKIGKSWAELWCYIGIKMAVATAQFYFRLRIGWCPSLQNVSLYQQTKLRRNISIRGRDINIPVWKNKRPPYWDPTSGFDHITVINMSFCARLPNFIKIGPPTTETWRHIDFQDGGRQPCSVCFGVTADQPHSVFCSLNSVLKSLNAWINSSGDIAIYRFRRFGLRSF